MESLGYIFKKHIREPNVTTPVVIDYIKKGRFIIELSKAEDTDVLFKNKVAVTVLDCQSGEYRHDLSQLCHNEDYARNYVKGLL